MKRIVSIATAIGLAASIGATASAADVPGTATAAPETVTTSTYSEPVITPADVVPATPVLVLTGNTPFYFTNGSTMLKAGVLAPQTVDTTGEVATDAYGNEWREVYTWLGLAWVMVPSPTDVLMP
ncbi:hypothetical protein PSTEL_23175 [Paenibacillus stellifer]|uniref:SH3b domain-containing protein n=1 Tax=Paenibacillus stellifer TaxID=169760 RepID=A0A089N9T5_9BACL|nr:hypothetical protein [Paenibacillus stellifer]AIQ65574.1 hypothetical protein PSTEL_23175 [Paenibacillus stellifer]